MAEQNDLRTREQCQTDLFNLNQSIPLAEQAVRRAQMQLDALRRDRDHTIERLFVLDHEYTSRSI